MGRDTLSLQEISRHNGSVAHQARLDVGPHTGLTIDARARTLYVGVGGTLRIFTLVPLQPLQVRDVCGDHTTRAIALFEPSPKVFIACSDGSIAEFDTALGQVVRRVRPSDSCSPSGAFLSANATVLFLACGRRGLVFLLDRFALAPIDSIDSGGRFDGIVLGASRRRAFLTRPSGAVEAWDLRENSLTDVAVDGFAPMVAAAGDGSIVVASATGFPLTVVGATAPVKTVRGPALDTVRALAVWPRGTPVMHWVASAPSPAHEPPQP